MDEVRNVRPIAGGMTGAVVALDATAHDAHRFVLKLYRPDPSEPDSAGREARILELLAPTDLPVPRVVAMDREGTDAVWPALLMTRMPGRRRFRPREVGPWLEGMSRLAARIHSAPVALDALPAHRLWGADDLLPLPEWWTKPDVWKAAVEVFRGPAPDEPVTFIHRDFHPGNLLWKGRRPSAIVDWVYACRGPVAVDVAHCRLNLWLDLGRDVADTWVEVTGGAHHPYWDIADALSWIPDSRTDGLTRRRRYEAFVEAAMAKLS